MQHNITLCNIYNLKILLIYIRDKTTQYTYKNNTQNSSIIIINKYTSVSSLS